MDRSSRLPAARRGWLLAASAALAMGCLGKEVPPPPIDSPLAAPESPPSAAAPASPAPPASAEPAPAAPRAARRVALEDRAMGTHVLLAAFTTDALDEDAIRPKLQKALDEIRRLEALMTTWR